MAADGPAAAPPGWRARLARGLGWASLGPGWSPRPRAPTCGRCCAGAAKVRAVGACRALAPGGPPEGRANCCGAARGVCGTARGAAMCGAGVARGAAMCGAGAGAARGAAMWGAGAGWGDGAGAARGAGAACTAGPAFGLPGSAPAAVIAIPADRMRGAAMRMLDRNMTRTPASPARVNPGDDALVPPAQAPQLT
jgi:hypothetical protein